MTYYSDLNGNFIIPSLNSGKHKIQVELISYEPMEIDLTKDQTLNINLIQYK